MNVEPLALLGAGAVLAIIPLGLGLVTCYLKVGIVLGVLRNALGLPQVAGAAAETALALVVTWYVMAPVVSATVAAGPTPWKPPADVTAAFTEAAARLGPLKSFLARHGGSGEREMLRSLGGPPAGTTAPGTTEPGLTAPNLAVPTLTVPGTTPPHDKAAVTAPPAAGPPDVTGADAPLKELVAAFVLTELREAFVMAFGVLVPFLVIDLVVANLLTGLGMFMTSPAVVALPIKLLVFTAADGWSALVRALVLSYGAP